MSAEPKKADADRSGPAREPQDGQEMLELLTSGEVTAARLHPAASNYTFVVRLESEGGAKSLAIYKPRKGEAPLWDFPDGTLYQREYASYVLAQALGWDFVPRTVIRDGPHGIGSMQQFIPHKPSAHYFTLMESFPDDFRRICLFDWFANNADRKAGACLLGDDGRIWGVDHGLTFNVDVRLRTVIWDFASQPVAPALLKDLEGLLTRLEAGKPPAPELGELLAPQELGVLKRRVQDALDAGKYPTPPTNRRSHPWPWF